jgi:hypothetical protein
MLLIHEVVQQILARVISRLSSIGVNLSANALKSSAILQSDRKEDGAITQE